MTVQGRPSMRLMVGTAVAQTIVLPILTAVLYALAWIVDGDNDSSRALAFMLGIMPISLALGLATLVAAQLLSRWLGLAALLVGDALAFVALWAFFDWRWLIAAPALLALSVGGFFGMAAIVRRDLERMARMPPSRLGIARDGRWFDAEAEVAFLPATGDGRPTPAHSGHLCTIAYDNRLRSADLWFGDDGTAAPGETVTARLRFTSPMRPENAIAPGTAFEVREGREAVAHGRIIRLLDSVEAAT